MTNENRDFILLGIKYESAKIAGVSEAALENIVGQIENEAGEEWESDAMVLRGRNAVRQEHGLNEIGISSEGNNLAEPQPRRPKWRLFGRRS